MKYTIKNKHPRAGETACAVKCMCCSCKWPKFSFQYSHRKFTSLAPEALGPLLASKGTYPGTHTPMEYALKWKGIMMFRLQDWLQCWLPESAHALTSLLPQQNRPRRKWMEVLSQHSLRPVNSCVQTGEHCTWWVSFRRFDYQAWCHDLLLTLHVVSTVILSLWNTNWMHSISPHFTKILHLTLLSKFFLFDFISYITEIQKH